MEILTAKQIVEELNRIAEENSALTRKQLDLATLAAWSEMHGWDAQEALAHRLVARQATLLALIKKSLPNTQFFATPLDALAAVLESRLDLEHVSDAPTRFNFWGELYNALIPQPERRRIGQFWTDELIADWMTAWLLQFDPKQIADVGTGSGNFVCQATHLIAQRHLATALYGCDISPLMLNVAIANLSARHLPLPRFAAEDYLGSSLPAETDAVICNPPYTRHHHISPEQKGRLQLFFQARFNITVSRQATMAAFFLLKIIGDLPDAAHAAVILPMQVFDARYGDAIKRALCRETSMIAIIHFAPEMNAFDKVDVGASILFLRKGVEKENLVRHVTLRALPTTEQLLELLRASEARETSFGSLNPQPQHDLDATTKWFSISAPPPVAEAEGKGITVRLGELATVMRGIATGANEFFALPSAVVKKESLGSFVVRTIQRNREIQDIVLDETLWQHLADDGKRVWLLYLNGDDVREHSPLSRYLGAGTQRGFADRSLVKTRKKWYWMEQRRIPPIFFTILTRGNPRFILNRAQVRPLNMFSLIYPNRQVEENDCAEILWALLNSDYSLSKLHSVSRTYGGNTLKVEPRELDNLPVLNPLSFPPDLKLRFKNLIAEFESERRNDVFLQKINHLVSEIVSGKFSLEPVRLQAKQLALLESRPVYKSKRKESKL